MQSSADIDSNIVSFGLKIAQINSVGNVGSTGRIAEQIGAAAMLRGHTSLIAHGHRYRPGESASFRVGGLGSALIHGVESFLLDRHGLGSRNETRKLIHWLESQEPDAIGLHNIHGYFLNYPILFDFLRRAELPVIWTLHDCWPFTGHCSYFDRFDCLKWQTECHDCPMTSYYPKSLVDFSRRNYRLKKTLFRGIPGLVVVTPSYWLKDNVQQSFLSEFPTQVIHNGVDLALFRPPEKYSDRKLVLGVANQWDDRKGLRDFIKLRDILPAAFEIVVVGVSKSQERMLPAGVSGIGRTESVEGLAGWYQRSAVFVNPTRSDNFPTTNVEALACGLPVITYDVGGSAESLSHETGRVVRPGDIDGLARAIEELAQDDRDVLGAACRARAEALFNKDDRFADYVDLYESLVA